MTEVISAVLVWVMLVIVIACLLAFPTMWLWNACLVPAVSFAKTIGFWQAMGLNFLSCILFKNTTTTSK